MTKFCFGCLPSGEFLEKPMLFIFAHNFQWNSLLPNSYLSRVRFAHSTGVSHSLSHRILLDDFSFWSCATAIASEFVRAVFAPIITADGEPITRYYGYHLLSQISMSIFPSIASFLCTIFVRKLICTEIWGYELVTTVCYNHSRPYMCTNISEFLLYLGTTVTLST